MTNKELEPTCCNKNINQSDIISKRNSFLPSFNSKKGSLVYQLEQELLNKISLNNSSNDGNNDFPEIPREIVLKIKLCFSKTKVLPIQINPQHYYKIILINTSLKI